ncbi:sensor histidine kinase [Sedimenticola hydrogenitrophicus]|uniref:sensor histidine kinase n=1 Tax=Sedimenticola hydrogenitrophicus TaxID=2967975 RepID=UPI0023AE70F4|nr:HAMP domain-containing sensor histidine kinase [Sedimenticola hydrogenitrophicus]
MIFSVALVHVVLMGLFTWEAVHRQSQELRQEMVNQGRSLASLMVVASTNALLAEDLASLAEVTRRVGEREDVSYGEIVDVRGYVMASTRDGRVGRSVGPVIKVSEQFPLVKTDRVLDLRQAVLIGDKPVGFVVLGLSTENLESALAATRNRGIQYTLLALVIGSVAAWLLSITVTRNLHALTLAAKRIGDGDLGARVEVRSQDEAGTLAHAFNSMAASLQRNAREIEQEHQKRTEAERLACVGEMAASIAHEIRNPLAALLNSVKLLGDQKLVKDDHAIVTRIVDTESKRLQRILDDFLTFSRLPAAQLQNGDLKQLVEETVELVRQDPRYSGRITFDCRYEPDNQCLFDPDLMRQVLLNLLLNAMQAMQGEGKLIVRLKRNGDRVNLSIVDNGGGIPEHIMSQISKPFFSGRKNGTGLGLSVVQRILAQHTSVLSITSREGSGTEACFDLDRENHG